MDIKVTQDASGNRKTYSAVNANGRRWLQKYFSTAEDHEVPARLAKMTERAMHADGLSVELERDEPYGDTADHYSILLAAHSIRAAGNGHEALAMLVKLRADVLNAMDQKSLCMLPMIDSEIAEALASIRTDRPSTRRMVKICRRRGQLKAWFHRTISDLEGQMLRIAISIVLVVEVYRFLAWVI